MDFVNPGSQGDGSFFGITDGLKGQSNGYPGTACAGSTSIKMTGSCILGCSSSCVVAPQHACRLDSKVEIRHHGPLLNADSDSLCFPRAGGAFDPLGYSRGDEARLNEYKVTLSSKACPVLQMPRSVPRSGICKDCAVSRQQVSTLQQRSPDMLSDLSWCLCFTDKGDQERAACDPGQPRLCLPVRSNWQGPHHQPVRPHSRPRQQHLCHKWRLHPLRHAPGHLGYHTGTGLLLQSMVMLASMQLLVGSTCHSCCCTTWALEPARHCCALWFGGAVNVLRQVLTAMTLQLVRIW